MRWRLIAEKRPCAPEWNMAADEALWRALDEGSGQWAALRIYGWEPPSFSLGHHQKPERALDLDFCRTAGYGVVVRPTGGKAVLHEHEVTYCVVGLQDGPPFAGGLPATYGALAAALSGALSMLGLPVAQERRQRASNPGEPSPCFLVPTQRELLVSGRKVVGSAQRRGRRAFLQHGSIPIWLDYEALARGTRNPPESVVAYRRAMAGLGEFIPDLTPGRLGDVLARSFRATFPGEWEEGGLTPAEEAWVTGKVGG